MKLEFVIGFIGVFSAGVLIGFSLAGFFDEVSLTGRAVEESDLNYTYTKAICNSENRCIDVLVECEGGKVKSLEPVSSLRFFGDKFEDFREDISGFCEYNEKV